MTFKTFAPLLASAFALAGCAAIPDAGSSALPEGSIVALNQSVRVGPLVATPLELVEDSRCPINARCIRAGDAIVKTRLSDGSSSVTANLKLGEPAQALGHAVQLSSVEPGRMTNESPAPRDYRFAYELAD